MEPQPPLKTPQEIIYSVKLFILDIKSQLKVWLSSKHKVLQVQYLGRVTHFKILLLKFELHFSTLKKSSGSPLTAVPLYT